MCINCVNHFFPSVRGIEQQVRQYLVDRVLPAAGDNKFIYVILIIEQGLVFSILIANR